MTERGQTGLSFTRSASRIVSLGLIASVCAFAIVGCGSATPYAEASLTEAKVSGRVTAAGKPVTKGQIIFDPANVNRRNERARTAELRTDGTYEVTTLIGENRVTVAIPVPRTKGQYPYNQRTCAVKVGINSLDIEL
jgi:hypothetical protein